MNLFFRGKPFVEDFHLVVNVVKRGENGHRKIDLPDRQIIKISAGRIGYGSKKHANAFVENAVDIKNINGGNDEKQSNQNEKQRVMGKKLHFSHISLS